MFGQPQGFVRTVARFEAMGAIATCRCLTTLRGVRGTDGVGKPPTVAKVELDYLGFGTGRSPWSGALVERIFATTARRNLEALTLPW